MQNQKSQISDEVERKGESSPQHQNFKSNVDNATQPVYKPYDDIMTFDSYNADCVEWN